MGDFARITGLKSTGIVQCVCMCKGWLRKTDKGKNIHARAAGCGPDHYSLTWWQDAINW